MGVFIKSRVKLTKTEKKHDLFQKFNEILTDLSCERNRDETVVIYYTAA